MVWNKGVYRHEKVLTPIFFEKHNNLTNKEISKLVGIDHNVVRRYRLRLGKNSALGRALVNAQKMRKLTLPDYLVGAIIGTMLGDANLILNNQGNARLRIRHAPKQREYVELKYRLFSPLCTRLPLYRQHGIGFSTVWHPTLTELYGLFYKDGRKRITQDILDGLTVPGLCLWFYDDGGKEILSTCNFTLDEIKLARQHLYRQFGIKTTPMRKSNGKKYYWYLYFAKGTRHILGKYLNDFYIPCFDYKVRNFTGSSETARGNLWGNLIDKIQSELMGDHESIVET